MMTTTSGISANRGVRGAIVGVLLVMVWAGLLGPLPGARPAFADLGFNQKMLELVNQQRAAAGIAPLQWSDSLGAAAEDAPYSGCGFTVQGRAKDMGQRNYFSHNILGCVTQSVFNLLGGLGIVSSSSGENIAWINGTTDPALAAERLTNDLMNSPSHRANILNRDFTHVGIGSWRTSPGQTWTGAGTPLANVWIAAQIFASMPTTPSPAVSLTPGSVDFGERAVGVAGASQTIRLTNPGSATVNLSGPSLSGANASDFSVSSTSCGTTLAAGASCAIAVSFTPAAAGSRMAAVNIPNSAAGSPSTVPLSGTGIAPLIVGTPTKVVATGGDARMTISWTAAPGGLPAGYGVFVYDANGYTGKGSWVCGACTSATVTGLITGKEYYAAVAAHNGRDWGASAISNWTWVVSAPATPTNVQSYPGNGAISVSWQLPAEGPAGNDGYGVYVYDSTGYTGKTAWVCATCASATVSGLSNGRSYYAIVFGHNATGWGGGAVSGWVVAGTPGLAGNVRATKGPGSVSVTWTAAATGGAPIAGYGVWLYDSASFTGKSLWVCAGCTNATITGLGDGTQYTVSVAGYNDFGWGASAYSSAVTL